jgi:transposase
MSSHHGQTIEKIIRKGGYSISDVARLMNVNRRTVYNWFMHRVLKQEIIYKLGHEIKFDFSVDFPEFFTPEDFVFKNKRTFSVEVYSGPAQNEELHWKEKYIDLEKRYVKLLQDVLRKEQGG